MQDQEPDHQWYQPRRMNLAVYGINWCSRMHLLDLVQLIHIQRERCHRCILYRIQY